MSTLIVKTIILIVFSTLPLVGNATDSSVHWGYTGQIGPEHWGNLAAEYSICSEGKAQSPVDVTNAVPARLPWLSFAYRPSPLFVINNGHTIQVNYARGSLLRIDDKAYELKQFHFHVPSEHTLHHQAGDMVVHLVHESLNNEVAVVAVIMNIGRMPNYQIGRIWENMPRRSGEYLENQYVMIHASQLLPAHRGYYFYTGSLTTPPCTEGVSWIVMKTPVQVSYSQVNQFKSIIGENARPTQSLYGRGITMTY